MNSYGYIIVSSDDIRKAAKNARKAYLEYVDLHRRVKNETIDAIQLKWYHKIFGVSKEDVYQESHGLMGGFFADRYLFKRGDLSPALAAIERMVWVGDDVLIAAEKLDTSSEACQKIGILVNQDIYSFVQKWKNPIDWSKEGYKL